VIIFALYWNVREVVSIPKGIKMIISDFVCFYLLYYADLFVKFEKK